jgi:hypothetical protein
MKNFITDSQTFSDIAELPAEDHELIVLHLTRMHVETGNLAHALDVLHVLTENSDNVRRYRDSLVFIVDGYNEDARELPQIPEVRQYFQALTKEWPHWFWFLARGLGVSTLLITLLCEVNVVSVNVDGDLALEIANNREMSQTILDLFERGNYLFDTYGISDEEVLTSAESISEDLGFLLGK